jgi:hypothetical protein
MNADVKSRRNQSRFQIPNLLKAGLDVMTARVGKQEKTFFVTL